MHRSAHRDNFTPKTSSERAFTPTLSPLHTIVVGLDDHVYSRHELCGHPLHRVRAGESLDVDINADRQILNHLKNEINGFCIYSYCFFFLMGLIEGFSLCSSSLSLNPVSWCVNIMFYRIYTPPESR